MAAGTRLPVRAAPQLKPEPTAVRTTGVDEPGACVAQATGNDADPRFPVRVVSLQIRVARSPRRRANIAGRRPLPP